MQRLLAKLWRDERAAIKSEWALLILIFILLVVLGFHLTRQAAMQGFLALADGFPGGSRSHYSTGPVASEPWTAGPSFKDVGDSIVVKSTAATPGGFDNRACD
jgi:hypothetical protein